MAGSLLLIIRPGSKSLGYQYEAMCHQYESEASVSILSESDSKRVTYCLGSKGSKPAIPSLLDRLQAPQKSELMWKWAIRRNPSAADSHHKNRPCCSTNPKSVTPSSRVREYPDEKLTVSAGKLFCTACRHEISLKRSIIANHIASVKHTCKQSKVKLSKKESRENDIVEVLVTFDEQEHPRGETLAPDRPVYHVKVVSAFLKAGVPLAKLDHFRDILEEHAYRLSDRRGMSDLIPFILLEENKRIKDEIDS